MLSPSMTSFWNPRFAATLMPWSDVVASVCKTLVGQISSLCMWRTLPLWSLKMNPMRYSPFSFLEASEFSFMKPARGFLQEMWLIFLSLCSLFEDKFPLTSVQSLKLLIASKSTILFEFILPFWNIFLFLCLQIDHHTKHKCKILLFISLSIRSFLPHNLLVYQFSNWDCDNS